MRITTKELLKQNQKLIDNICWGVANNTGHDQKDLLDESNSIFWMALDSYNGRASLFSTWLVNQLKPRLKNHVQRIKPTEPISDGMDFSGSYGYFLVDILGSVSDNAKEVIFLILNSPNDFIDMIIAKDSESHIKGPSLALIRKYLFDKGWSLKTINICFEEIKNTLRET